MQNFNRLNKYSHGPVCKEELDFYCNTVWLMHILNCGENGLYMVP